MSETTVPAGMIRLTFTRPEAQALLEAGELALDVRETRDLPVPAPLRVAIVRLSKALKGGRALQQFGDQLRALEAEQDDQGGA